MNSAWHVGHHRPIALCTGNFGTVGAWLNSALSSEVKGNTMRICSQDEGECAKSAICGKKALDLVCLSPNSFPDDFVMHINANVKEALANDIVVRAPFLASGVAPLYA